MLAQALSPGAIPDPEPKPPKEEEWQQNLNVRLICRDCREDPPELREDHASGDLICENCGLVLQQRSIDTSSEWRTFSNDDQGNDDPSRVGDGPNALLNGAQLNTNIAFGDGGMRSKELHRAQNKANHDKSNKLLLQAYKQIGALCDGWQLPYTVSESAKHIYKDADESRLFKGKSQDALIAGCVFTACRRNNVARTFREVMELTRVSKKEIGRTFKLLENFLINKDKAKKAGEDNAPAVANGKSSSSSLVLHFLFILTKHVPPPRCQRVQRSLQRQHHRRSRRPLPAFLQHVGNGPARHQRRHRAGHHHDQDRRSGRPLPALLRRGVHLHGGLPHG
jgi:transcription initiation factor TFIIB